MSRLLFTAILGLTVSATSPLLAQFSAADAYPTVRITQSINESRLVTLGGNVRPEVAAAKDLGPVEPGMKLDHMLLLLQRSPEQEAALQTLIGDLHNPQSRNFHKWLTPTAFGAQYGVAQADLDTVSHWLESHGLTVNTIYTNRLLIDFSGEPEQVKNAFHTELHNLDVNGVQHIANMSDPQIPAVLAPVVSGVVSLNDFMPHPLAKPKITPAYSFTSDGEAYEALVPGDIETIYNLNPLYSAGISGQGQTIAVIEDSFIANLGDWSQFRKTFGLTRKYNQGSIVQIAPSPSAGGSACAAPGITGDEPEAEIDVEYATAAAPSAAIVLAACPSTRTTFGGLIALQNLLNGSNAVNGSTAIPAIVSISYGDSETLNGVTANAAYNSAYQQGVAEGVSIFVSAGDEGAAGADAGKPYATHGITVSGFASTPYNISVGGTDFADTYFATNSTYWSSTNGTYDNSALSYIPEIPWNNSCAGGLLAAIAGFTPGGLCNTSPYDTSDYFLTTTAGSGGASNCAKGNPSTPGVTSGTCAGYAKPSWQAGLVGNPSDGVRDIPDVALFASNGFWGHYYVVCFSDTAEGGTSCAGAPGTWAGFGGTSISSPIMAGIQSLVNQYTGQSWGNANTVYYTLANVEYGASGSSRCNSEAAGGPSSNCVFYDITLGDMDIPCRKSNGSAGALHNCYLPGGTNGLLSTSNAADQPAYGSNVGWDFATGIGSVNAYNLVMQWNTALAAASLQTAAK